MNFADHSSTQKSGEDGGIDFIVFNLRFDGDARLEGIGQNDVFLGDMGCEEFVESRSVHGCLEQHAAGGVALDEFNEELRSAVLDASSLKDVVGGINRAKKNASS